MGQRARGEQWLIIIPYRKSLRRYFPNTIRKAVVVLFIMGPARLSTQLEEAFSIKIGGQVAGEQYSTREMIIQLAPLARYPTRRFHLMWRGGQLTVEQFPTGATYRL